MLHEQCHKAVAVCLLAGWVLPPIIPTVYKHATCCLRAQPETGTVLFYVVSVCIVNPFATCSRSSFKPIAFNELCWAVLMLLLLDLVIHKEVGPHFCQFVGSSYEKVHWFQWSCTGDWSTLCEKLCSVGEWKLLKVTKTLPRGNIPRHFQTEQELMCKDFEKTNNTTRKYFSSEIKTRKGWKQSEVSCCQWWRFIDSQVMEPLCEHLISADVCQGL